jgi:hypothetical protein
MTLSSITNTIIKKDKHHLILEGKFIAEKHVSYQVFEVAYDKSLVLQSTHKGSHYYSIQTEVGKSYVVKFTTKSGNIKYLNLDVQNSGYFMVDVDFRNSKSASLTYTGWYDYKLKPLNKEELCYERKQSR